MNRRQVGRLIIGFIPILMIIWGSYQLYDLYASKHTHQNATRMLFEASSFQIELMSRFMSEAVSARMSSQLDSLRNSVYSAIYVHDRLASAFPAGQIDDLASLKEILQYLLHLQIGGERPLKQEEKSLLNAMDSLCKELAEAYSGMMGTNGKLKRYERGMVKELDDKLLKLLKQNR